MTTITLEIPDALARRAGWAAQALHRPLEEVIAAKLEGVLPALEDVPAQMQAELIEMTWLGDSALQAIPEAVLSDANQQRLTQISGRDGLTEAERQEIDDLRDRYGRITLRKARAQALLSVRSGKGLLAIAEAA
jgi:hypothetical protein